MDIPYFLYKVRVEVWVFFHRLAIIWETLPVLWKHHYDFQFHSILPLLEVRLQRLEKVLREDDIHEGMEEAADQVAQCLESLETFQDPSSRHPKPEGAKAGFQRSWDSDGRGLARFQSNQEFDTWSREIEEIENRAWERVWDLIQKYGRNWVS